jgi:hypothetical protein
MGRERRGGDDGCGAVAARRGERRAGCEHMWWELGRMAMGTRRRCGCSALHNGWTELLAPRGGSFAARAGAGAECGSGCTTHNHGMGARMYKNVVL